MTAANPSLETTDTEPCPLAQPASSVKEVVITRILDAPRHLVFRLWTEPEHVAQWWGPKGFTNPVCELDVRSGGAIRIHMQGPDGTIYPMGGVFHEIDEPERIVFTSTAFEDEAGIPGLEISNTVTFDELDGKTKVTIQAIVLKASPAAAGGLAGMEAGWNQSIEKLEAHLARASGVEQAALTASEFLITRVFDAPRDLVWQAFTESERLMQWWGPKDFTMLSCKADLRPGGTFHYGMRSPDGHTMWGKWVYIEIAKPERLVTIVSFTDEAGNAVRHPLNPTWPMEMLTRMTLIEQAGKTTLIIQAVPHAATEVERKTFVDGHKSMEQGFNGTLNKLAAYLAGA
ncbi:MAG: SRPBCC domain-containing protein [Abitibacteriaceae bacterium]|nr:SRPBCC domain-containing protein [Abditibacteriaceae bacterium]